MKNIQFYAKQNIKCKLYSWESYEFSCNIRAEDKLPNILILYYKRNSFISMEFFVYGVLFFKNDAYSAEAREQILMVWAQLN